MFDDDLMEILRENHDNEPSAGLTGITPQDVQKHCVLPLQLQLGAVLVLYL